MAKTTIGKIARSVNTAVKKGSRDAANKALAATEKKVYKDLKDKTGLPKKILDARIQSFKATRSIPKVKIQIATKRGINLADEAFKPKEKAVKVTGRKTGTGKGRPRSRTYYGVTVKVGNQPRQLVPGGFLRSVGKKQKDLVLKRRGKGRLPVDAQKTDIFQVEAKALQPEANKYLKDEFDKASTEAINNALKKTLGSSGTED